MSTASPLGAWQECVPFLQHGQHLPLLEHVAQLRKTHTIYPPQENIFAALTLTPPEMVRVVILGQDPYHGPGQAHGLSFSVPQGQVAPPSLVNIFKEIHADIYANRPMPAPINNLSRWAVQGVLLLNTVLTVEEGKPQSHSQLGWKELTQAILEYIAAQSPVAVLLWGRSAHAFAPLFATGHHYVLQAAHPSPLSAHRGFLGCRHFSKTNAWLVRQGHAPICW